MFAKVICPCNSWAVRYSPAPLQGCSALPSEAEPRNEKVDSLFQTALRARHWSRARGKPRSRAILMDAHGKPARTGVCTIVSKNYFHFARTLMDSVRAAHPDWEQYVLLVDEFGQGVEPGCEPFHLVSMTDLGLPDIKKFCFRYTLLELNTSVKPWLLASPMPTTRLHPP